VKALLGTLIVIAKAPVPGRVKTRLVPPLSYSQAADIAGSALRDTLRVAASVPARMHLLAFDGDAAPWRPPGWQVVDQPPGGLDVRLAAAFAAARPGEPALLVGMDTPQLRPEQLTAFDPVRYDAVLGPADDGGYWAIGFRDPAQAARAIPGVPMSTPHTGAEQLRRLAALRVQLLESLIDVDTIDAAEQVAAAAPQTQFAQTLAAMSVTR
jgi:glycosyltransferase A (GT-A) superfamily protein (DUF2064 family)